MKGIIELTGYNAPVFEDEKILCSCCGEEIQGTPKIIQFADNAREYLEVRFSPSCYRGVADVPFCGMSITTGEGWKKED